VKPSEQINEAFLTLEFVLKLVCHAELGRIDPTDFNQSVTVQFETINRIFNDGAFNTIDGIVLAAQNCHTLAFGFSANALDRAIKDSGIADSIPDIRDLVYMLRCAFAHPDDSLRPCWEVRGPFVREFRLDLPSGPLKIDLRVLHGQPLEYHHIGGPERYFELKDCVLQLVLSREEAAGNQ
jgi:hypothetical protein